MFSLRRAFSSYIHISGTPEARLKLSKILHAHARPSIMYIYSPYVLDVKYAVPDRTVFYANFGKVSIPIESTDPCTYYKFEFTTKEAVTEVVDELRNGGVSVDSDL